MATPLNQASDRKVHTGSNDRRRDRPAPALEVLDSRVLLSVTALFAAGELRVTGDDLDNVITVSRDVAGTILVNHGAVPIQGGTPTIANTNHLHLVGAGGNDNISLDETNGALPGAALFGGAGNDVLVGGSGIDFADGEAGNDTVSLGAGDDTFQWNPGDGSDVVDGQAGNDTMVFNGADVAEKINISANGNRVLLTRDVGTVNMDLDGVEEIDFNAFGGVDSITVNDQSATDLMGVNLDLSNSAGTGDGQPDAVIINGTDGDDVGQIASRGARIAANMSLSPVVNIAGAEGSNDTLTLNALGGNDIVDASLLSANLIGLALNGGAGSDQIFGSQGNDQVNGGTGSDKVFMEGGDDTFVWNAGDANDVVEGQDGTDTMVFNGSNADENIDISANGSRVALTDDVGDVFMDIDGVEQTSVSPLSGADNIVVNDLAGTAITNIKVHLIADGQPDNVTVNGSNSNDTIGVAGDFANGVTVTGLAAQVDVIGAIGVAEGLTVNALGAADTIDASALEIGAIKLALNGGDGNDVLTSSQGDDLIDGGAQTDTINVIGSAATGVVTVLPSTGDDTVNVNTDGVGVANVAFDATQRIGALNVGSGGIATLTSGSGKVLTVTSLSIAGTGKLDLSDNDLIVDYSGVSPIATIQSLLASGFQNGAWDGNGINSSSAAATIGTALGFAEATSLFAAFPASFDGQSIDSSSLIVRFTRAGDANLDRKVNTLDFNALALNFGGRSRNWAEGDFNYDGVVNALDFNALAVNFGSSLPLPAAVESIASEPPPAGATSTPRTLFSTRVIRNPVGLFTTVA